MSRQDLDIPEVARASRDINQLARWMWWRRVPFAVNASLRTRWRIRWHKMWEYARGLGYGSFLPGMRVLDFGGAATLPIFYLGRLGCDVLSLDIDEKLSAYTNELARQRGWKVQSSTLDLTQHEAPAEWHKFDRIISYCVLEHLPKHLQQAAIARLAGLLKPGGIFALTFDYGHNAPVSGAIRNKEEVEQLIEASNLSLIGNREFLDTQERFTLDKKYPNHDFTFGSLFLEN
jgi:2-polyprenyl-3-methyl-5-hydroxy-6-metoxy-1,4-benzoquinol methylase